MTASRLTIIQHNVQNWRTNRITLSNIYNQTSPDIILLNSHSLTNNDQLKIFNYNVFSCNKSNENHAGAAIAIKKGLTFRLHDNFYSDLLAITIDSLQGPITIATSYVPPRRNYLNLIDYHNLFSYDNPVYLFSDLNARHHCLGYNDNNRRGDNLKHLIDRNICTHIGPFFPTIITHRSCTSPDIILKNNRAFYNTYFHPGPPTPSDHIPIIGIISANPIQVPIPTRNQFHNADWTKYKHDLSTVLIPDDPHPTLEEIDACLDDWTDKIITASNSSIPKISHRTIPGIKPNQETLTTEHDYSTLLNDIILNGPSLDKYRRLIGLRHRINNLYNLQYSDNWNQIINNLQIQQNPKHFWTTVRRLSGNTRQAAPYLKDHNNRRIDSDVDKEKLFRDHWSKVYNGQDDEDNEFNDDNIDAVTDFVTNNYDNTTSFHTGDLSRLDPNDCPPITIDDLKSLIKRTKQKSPGPTGITTLHLKNLPLNMIHYLLYIFNQSLSAGYFPDKLKLATVIFIPKPNKSPYHVTNYRPISLLDIHGKILDRILKDRLYNRLEIDDKLNERQHGFRQFRGTNTALAVFHQQLVINSARRMEIDVTLRDVTKAFDKVWHLGLKYKILQLGLHPSLTRTICDFLTDRQAQIRLGTFIGPKFSLLSGVPQGAVLSPTLYSLYTHDLPPPIPDTDYIMYADDITQIIATQGNISNNTEHAIRQINSFENNWKIQTNVNKFKIINIRRRKTDDIFINDQHVPYSNSGKILGLNFSTCSYRSQVTTRCILAKQQLTKILRFHNLSIKNKTKLYLALVRSTLLYPPIPLHTLKNSPMLKLQRIQNRALRFIYNTHWTDFISSSTLHTRSLLPPINIVLHNQAKKIWETLEIVMPNSFDSLTLPPDTPEHSYFRDSKSRALGPTPQPLIT